MADRAPSPRAVIAWVALLPWAGWLAARLLDVTPGYRGIELVAFTPYVAASALLPLGLALLLRRWGAAAVALAIVAAFAAVVLPRALGASEESPAGTNELTVMTLNMSDGEADAQEVVALVREYGVDVLSLQEISSEGRPNLARAGLRRVLPTEAQGTDGTWIYAAEGASPVDPAAGEVPVAVVPRVRLETGGILVEVLGPHPLSPTDPRKAASWRQVLAAIPGPEKAGPLRIVAGDLNATLDHSELRDVLERGYVDAADEVGAGLAPTYPADGLLPPPITIDHVLADERIEVLDASIHDVAGSDHRALIADLAIPRE
jgi:endonuclease/exonuclease/phosphatase (EEP) superfamily protein YafD